MKPLLIAMMGLPRSGKSTIATQLSKTLGAPIVCKDSIRLALHGDRYKSEAEDYVRAIGKTMIKSLFLRGHEIVIADETHWSKAARNHIKDDLYKIEWFPVMTGANICKERAIKTGQEDLIPVIDEMWNRLEPLEEDDPIYFGAKQVEYIVDCMVNNSI